LIGGIIAAHPVSQGWTQNSPNPIAANDNSVAANPLLGALARSDPGAVQIVVLRLDALSAGKLRPSSARLDDPTEKEKVQFTQNPAFAATRQNNPDETLKILRWVNALIGQ
jgi:hypothetical protein